MDFNSTVTISSARKYTNKKGKESIRGDLVGPKGGFFPFSAPSELKDLLDFVGKQVKIQGDIRSFEKQIYITIQKIG